MRDIPIFRAIRGDLIVEGPLRLKGIKQGSGRCGPSVPPYRDRPSAAANSRWFSMVIVRKAESSTFASFGSPAWVIARRSCNGRSSRLTWCRIAASTLAFRRSSLEASAFSTFNRIGDPESRVANLWQSRGPQLERFSFIRRAECRFARTGRRRKDGYEEMPHQSGMRIERASSLSAHARKRWGS
jgi:hypothetical protein